MPSGAKLSGSSMRSGKGAAAVAPGSTMPIASAKRMLMRLIACPRAGSGRMRTSVPGYGARALERKMQRGPPTPAGDREPAAQGTLLHAASPADAHLPHRRLPAAYRLSIVVGNVGLKVTAGTVVGRTYPRCFPRHP